eukprot:11414272-Prorocentrum_lima.AAC.1
MLRRMSSAVANGRCDVCSTHKQPRRSPSTTYEYVMHLFTVWLIGLDGVDVLRIAILMSVHTTC